MSGLRETSVPLMSIEAGLCLGLYGRLKPHQICHLLEKDPCLQSKMANSTLEEQEAVKTGQRARVKLFKSSGYACLSRSIRSTQHVFKKVNLLFMHILHRLIS